MNERDPERRSKSDRLTYILSQMRSPNEITPARLAEELSVSERTIYRDLLTLEQGQTLKKRYSRSEGRYRLETELALPLALTPAEAFALFSAAANPALDESLPFATELRSALQKLGASLADTATKNPETPDAALPQTPFALSEETLRRATLETLRRAQKANTKISIQYWIEQERGFRPLVLAPYLLRERAGRWYLLAQCDELDGMRLFRLEGIRQAETLAERFRFPRQFDAEKAFINVWRDGLIMGKITTAQFRFSAQAAPAIVNSRGGQFLKMEMQPDGSLICTARLSRRSELNWWLLSYGSEAEALAPQELRDEFAQMTQAMASRYEAV